MNGFELAQAQITQFQTRDPFVLAARAGVCVQYARWHPVTWGEYDSRSRSICLNLAAPVPLEGILAHELGHYFSQKYGAAPSRVEEEQIAEEFARALRQ
jgi:Zn-dependent peptidase ImmA (M78 family)